MHPHEYRRRLAGQHRKQLPPDVERPANIRDDVDLADARGPPADAAETPRPRKLVKWPVVHELTGKSRSQAWRDIRAGKFPVPVQTGINSVAWYLDEIEAYVASRPRVNYAPVAEPQEAM